MKKLLLPILLLGCALSLRAAILPAEKILPDDTLVVLSIPDFAKARDLYNKSPHVQMWSDPSVKAFKDKFMNKLKSEVLTPLERDMAIKFDDYTGLAQGQLTIAMTQDGWTGKPGDTKDPSLLILMDTKDKSSQLKANLADLKKKWVDAGKPLKTEKIRDIEFTVFSISSNDLPKSLRGSGVSAEPASTSAADKKDSAKSDGKQPMYVGQSDSLLIMGTSPRSIEKVLSAMAGGSVKTLGEMPTFAANYNSLFRDAPMYAWGNVAAFVNMFLQSQAAGAPASPFMPDTTKLLPALGLTGLRTLAVSYNQTPEGMLVNMQLSVPEQYRTGLFKIIAGEAKEAKPPAFVPADVVKFQRWRIDGQKSYETLRKIIRDVSAETLGYLDQMIGGAEAQAKEKDPAFDMNKNLFGNLGDDVITYSKAPKGSTLADLAAPPTLYLIGSPAPEKLVNALRTLMALTGEQPAPKEREFLGRKIYTIPFPGIMPSADDGKGGLNYASSGGYLAVSMDTSILEEYLRSSDGTAKSLRDLPGLNDAAQKVGGPGTSLFAYQNDIEAERSLYNLLKKTTSDDGMDELGSLGMLLSSAGGEGFKFKDWVDVSLLPSYDKISKYFYFTVSGAGATPEGLFLKAFSPVPPEMKK